MCRRIKHVTEISGVADWSYGIPFTYLDEMMGFWETEYDWRKHEEELNGFHPYKTVIDGLEIHFFHVKADRKMYGEVSPGKV